MTMPSPPPAPARSDFVTVLAWIFVVLAGFAIAMLALQAIVISALPFGEIQKYAQQSPNDSYAMQEMVFGGMLTVMMAGGTILAIALAVLFGWIIKRLISPDIRREFGAA